MIELKNISITYQKPLIKSCDLSFPDKSVTLIQGPSGTGKTSLLYRIGLISKDENFAYYINGKQITTSSEKETLRKLNFGYVLQDSTLFEHYDVMGNMKLYASIAGYDYQEEDYKAFLSKVHLSIDLHQSIQTLSGGERQRVAIACALCKQPDVLILDEINSALDKENEIHIFEILKELAHHEHKCIILASHSQYAATYVDKIYEIKNQEIICKKDVARVETQVIKTKEKKLTFAFYKDYIYYFFQKYKLLNVSILIVMCLTFFMFLQTFVMFNYYENNSKHNFEQLYENQLLVVENRASLYTDRVMKQLSDKTISDVSSLDEDYEAFPYIKAGMICGNEWIDILPYFPQNHFDDKVKITYHDKGVYVSQEAYDTLKEAGNEKTLTGEIMLYEYKDNEPIPHPITVDIPIKGVLKENVKAPYIQGRNYIYMEQSMIEKLYQEHAASKTYAGMTLLTKDYKDLVSIKKDLKNKEVYYNTDFCDTETISDIMRNITIVKLFSIASILFIFVVMFGAFQTNYLYKRNNEMALLIINGMNHKGLDKLLSLESLFKYLIACITSSIGVLLIVCISNLIGISLPFPGFVLYIGFLCITFIMSVILTKFYSSAYLKHLSPESVLRN